WFAWQAWTALTDTLASARPHDGAARQSLRYADGDGPSAIRGNHHVVAVSLDQSSDGPSEETPARGALARSVQRSVGWQPAGAEQAGEAVELVARAACSAGGRFHCA